MTDIEVGCVVIAVPDDQSNCPNQHDDTWDTDTSLDGKMARVIDMGLDLETGCICITLDRNPQIEWCIGTWRRVHPGKIPNPSVQVLEPA